MMDQENGERDCQSSRMDSEEDGEDPNPEPTAAEAKREICSPIPTTLTSCLEVVQVLPRG